MRKTKGTVNEIDLYVSERVKLARAEYGMTQERLGELVGMTFQQIQKYERGMNRVAAGNLAKIAYFLEKPVAWFFPPEYSPDVSDYQAEIDRLTAIIKAKTEALREICDETDKAL